MFCAQIVGKQVLAVVDAIAATTMSMLRRDTGLPRIAPDFLILLLPMVALLRYSIAARALRLPVVRGLVREAWASIVQKSHALHVGFSLSSVKAFPANEIPL